MVMKKDPDRDLQTVLQIKMKMDAETGLLTGFQNVIKGLESGLQTHTKMDVKTGLKNGPE